MRRRLWALAVAVLLAAPACTASAAGPPVDLDGEVVDVLAVWTGQEAVHFTTVLRRFEERTGARARYTSTDGQDLDTVIGRMTTAGRPPDVVVLPQPGLLPPYAASGLIEPVGEAVAAEVRDHYADVWRELGSVDGELYGVWFKAAHKSLVWYSIAAFEQAGVVPPEDIPGLLEVAERVTASGVPAFAVAGADGWTLTDLFENVYLRTAGPDRYDALAERRLPWTDRTVHVALRLLRQLLAPHLVAGGPSGALATHFGDAVAAVAGSPPGAAMLVEGDFVAGVIEASPGAVGVDADVFAFPDLAGRRLVIAGGDVAVVLRRSAGADALLGFLAEPEAGEVWAALGGFLSPNRDVDLVTYPDDRTRAIARTLVQAGDDVRFDLSDLQPAAFGATQGEGMLGILQDFLADPSDAAGTAARLEAAVAAAYAGLDGVGVAAAPSRGTRP